ncbi:hypothetical protein GCM10010206_79120 [Streptomyces cinerochromogenes]|nr:hypothetical protein GCM10010206_79120 [Streptomyces cinerochromogenes]
MPPEDALELLAAPPASARSGMRQSGEEQLQDNPANPQCCGSRPHEGVSTGSYGKVQVHDNRHESPSPPPRPDTLLLHIP